MYSEMKKISKETVSINEKKNFNNLEQNKQSETILIHKIIKLLLIEKNITEKNYLHVTKIITKPKNANTLKYLFCKCSKFSSFYEKLLFSDTQLIQKIKLKQQHMNLKIKLVFDARLKICLWLSISSFQNWEIQHLVDHKKGYFRNINKVLLFYQLSHPSLQTYCTLVNFD